MHSWSAEGINMKTPRSKETEAVVPVGSAHVVEAAGAALGALGGAATGAAMAGPLGAVVGAVIGGAMGASSGWAADQASSDQAAAEASLDEEIGVAAGTIGSPNLKHPASKLDAPSAAAVGAGASVVDSQADDAAGPMQTPPD